MAITEGRPLVAGAVLVADRERSKSDALAASLERAGHSACVASHCDSAVALARTHQPDIVVLDPRLPGCRGLEGMRRLLDAPVSPGLVLAGRGGVPERIAALRLGADDYVLKPFDPGELVARVRRSSGGA